jgi:hypothetical protein
MIPGTTDCEAVLGVSGCGQSSATRTSGKPSRREGAGSKPSADCELPSIRRWRSGSPSGWLAVKTCSRDGGGWTTPLASTLPAAADLARNASGMLYVDLSRKRES